jgi:hypothetical protein
MARFWAGRIAVTEHIPASRLMSPVPMLAAGGRGDADSGVASGCAVRLVHGGGGGSPGRFMDGLRASGAGAPSRGMKREAERTRFARLIHAARPRSWRTCGPRRLQWQAESGLIAAHGGGRSGAGSAFQAVCRQRPGAETGGGRPYRPTHRRRRRPRSYRAPCTDRGHGSRSGECCTARRDGARRHCHLPANPSR